MENGRGNVRRVVLGESGKGPNPFGGFPRVTAGPE